MKLIDKLVSLFKPVSADGIVWAEWSRKTLFGTPTFYEGGKEVRIINETDNKYKVRFLDNRFPDTWTEKENVEPIGGVTL